MINWPTILFEYKVQEGAEAMDPPTGYISFFNVAGICVFEQLYYSTWVEK